MKNEKNLKDFTETGVPHPVADMELASALIGLASKYSLAKTREVFNELYPEYPTNPCAFCEDYTETQQVAGLPVCKDCMNVLRSIALEGVPGIGQ